MSSRLNLLCELNLTNSVIFPRKLHKNICSGSGPNLQMSLDIENIIITDEMLMLRWQCAVLPRCYRNWVSTHHCYTGAGSNHDAGARLNYNLQHAATGPVQWSTLPSVCPPWCLSMAMSPCRHQPAISSDINMLRLFRIPPKALLQEKPICAKNPFKIICIGVARLIGQNCAKSSQFFLVYNLFGNLHNIRSMLILEIVLSVLPN